MRITLREDNDAGMLRRPAKQSGDVNQLQCLLALASIYDGCKRLDAARISGIAIQIVRDRVLRFTAQGPEGLIDRKPPDAAPKLTTEHRAFLAQIAGEGLIPALHGAVRWRIKDQVAWLHEEFCVSVCEITASVVLKSIGFVKLTARPRHHGRNEQVLKAFKEASLRNSRSSEPDCVRKHR